MPCAPTSSTCLTIQMLGSSSRPVAGIRTMTDLPAMALPVAAIAAGSTSHCIHVRSVVTSYGPCSMSKKTKSMSSLAASATGSARASTVRPKATLSSSRSLTSPLRGVASESCCPCASAAGVATRAQAPTMASRGKLVRMNLSPGLFRESRRPRAAGAGRRWQASYTTPRAPPECVVTGVAPVGTEQFRRTSQPARHRDLRPSPERFSYAGGRRRSALRLASGASGVAAAVRRVPAGAGRAR